MGIAVGSSSYLLASGAALAGTMPTSAFAAIADTCETIHDNSTFEYNAPAPFFARSRGMTGTSGGVSSSKPKRVEDLMGDLRDSDYKKRVNAAKLLGEAKTATAIDPLINMAERDSSRHARQAAVSALGKIGDPSCIEALSKIAQNDATDEVRQTCVRTLLDIGTPEAMDEIAAIAKDNSKRGVRDRAIKVLAEGRDERAIPYLIATLADSTNGNARMYLTKFGSETVPQLIQALEHSDSRDVRLWAAILLRQIGDKRAAPALIERIKEDPDDGMRLKAIQAIAMPSVGSDLALESLCRGLVDPDENVRERCDHAIRMLGNRMENALISVSRGHGKSPATRQTAVALARLGNKEAIHSVLTVIYDESEPLAFRMEALAAYANIDDPRAPAVLANINTQSEVENPELRKTIESYLERKEREEAEGTKDLPKDGVLRIETIAEEIAQKLVNALDLASSPQLFASDVESYDEVNYGVRKPRLGQRQMMLPPNETIAIDKGTDEKTMRTMLRSLNFLVPHAIAHVLQEEEGIPWPEIDAKQFPRFNPERIEISANEAMLDGLAFEMAAKFYVSNMGDELFDEDARAAISINAAIALHDLILSDHRSGKRALSEEGIARMIAVEQAISFSDSASKNAKLKLRSIAKAFSATAISKMDRKHRAEFNKLVETLKKIFNGTKLDNV